MTTSDPHPVQGCIARFDAPPNLTPADHGVDGPLLGNGDMGVCLSGPPEAPRFHLSKNDFWKLRSDATACGPRPVGTLDIRMPALCGATYRIEQRLRDAVTTGEFRARDGLAVHMETWLAATENCLVIDRTWGAFLVSAELRDGIVRGVEIVSERGRDCTLVNPWPGHAVRAEQ